jgi:hypothetical protein
MAGCLNQGMNWKVLQKSLLHDSLPATITQSIAIAPEQSTIKQQIKTRA